MNFRRLKASEVEARVSTVSEKGCSLLLYKDARVDMNILDETVGSMNWQREHQVIDGRLYCTVKIWDAEKGQWISKQDVGTESNTEKEKGQASDSFKRACFNVGIGRELYTAPFIWISKSKVNLEPGYNGKLTTKDRFIVSDIGYDDYGNINKLVIRNEKTESIVYQLGKPTTEEQKDQAKADKVAEEKITEVQLKSIRATIEKNPDKISEEGICKHFGLKKLEDMTTANLTSFIKVLNGGE